MTGSSQPTYTQLAGRVLGLPYTEGGSSPKGGFDCAGLALWALRELGFDPPEGCMSGDAGECWELLGHDYRAASRPGDIIVSDSSTELSGPSQAIPPNPHVTVMVDPGTFMCLTAHVGAGVIGMKSYLVSDLVGVYRLR